MPYELVKAVLSYRAMAKNANNSSLREPLSYPAAVEVQRGLVARRARGDLPDLFWVLEHRPTITWGRASGLEKHLLLSEEEYRQRGIELCPTNRGGDVTFHEPGQLIGYPIVRLEGDADRDLHLYLRRIEAAVVRFLRELGLEGARIAGRTGVWLDGTPPRKIAAIGVRFERWVTSHGFALNVENSLEGFGTIVPCGIDDAAVTSLERELGRRELPSWPDLCTRLHGALEESLERPLLLVVGRDAMRLGSS